MHSKFRSTLSAVLVFVISLTLFPQSVAASVTEETKTDSFIEVKQVDDDSLLSVSEIEIDEEAPTLIAVEIYSKNQKSVNWAKINDMVVIDFLASEELDWESMGVKINGVDAQVKGSGDAWLASRIMTNGDVEGVVSFEINYSDLAGNQGDLVSSTSNGSSVTFDKTDPSVKLEKSVESKTSAPLEEINDTQKSLVGRPIYIEENYNQVDVKASIKPVGLSRQDVGYYLVDFSVSDQAGNETILKDVKIDFADSLSKEVIGGGVMVKVIGAPITETARYGNYDDEGAKVSWDNSEDIVSLELLGNLNLSKVSADSAPYTINYLAYIDGVEPANNVEINDFESSLFLPSSRTIIVSDNAAPKISSPKIYSGDGYVKISWENPSDIDFMGVNIYRCNLSGDCEDVLDSVSPENSVYEDHSVINDKKYYYTLEAYDDVANSSRTGVLAGEPKSISKEYKIAGASYSYEIISDDSKEKKDGEVNGGIDDERETKEKKDSPVKVLGLYWFWWVLIVAAVGGGGYWYFVKNKTKEKNKNDKTKKPKTRK